jgi:hypothetical protein
VTIGHQSHPETVNASTVLDVVAPRAVAPRIGALSPHHRFAPSSSQRD